MAELELNVKLVGLKKLQQSLSSMNLGGGKVGGSSGSLNAVLAGVLSSGRNVSKVVSKSGIGSNKYNKGIAKISDNVRRTGDSSIVSSVNSVKDSVMASVKSIREGLTKEDKAGGTSDKSKDASGQKQSKDTGTSIIGLGMLGALFGILASVESVTTILSVIGAVLNSFVAPFVPILLGIMKPLMIMMQPLVKKLLERMKGAAKDLKTGGVLQGIGGAVTGQTNDGGSAVSDETKKTIGSLVAAIATIAGIIVVINALATVWSSLVAAWAVVTAVVGVIGTVLGVIGTAVGLAASTVAIIIVLIIAAIIAIVVYWDEIVAFFKKSWEGWKMLFEDAWNGLKNIMSTIWDKMVVFFNDAWDGLKGILGNVTSFFGGIFDDFLNGFKTVLANVINFFIGIFNKFNSGFAAALNGVIRFLNRIPGVDIKSRVSAGTVEQFKFKDSGAANTTININIEGSADEATVEATVLKMRAELSRRGVF
jgi:uncharacterized membrane protein